MRLPWKVKFIDDKEIFELNIGSFNYIASYNEYDHYWRLGKPSYFNSHNRFEILEDYVIYELLLYTTKRSRLVEKYQNDLNAINEIMNKVDRSWPYSLFKEQ